MAPGLVHVNAPAHDAMSSAFCACANVHKGPEKPLSAPEPGLGRLGLLLLILLLNNDFKKPAVNASPAPVVSTFMKHGRRLRWRLVVV